LYEALSGHRPFSGDDLSSLAYAVVHAPVVPVSQRRDGLPAGLDQFFARALAKSPGERFADGRTFSRELADALAAAPMADSAPTMAATGLLHEIPPPLSRHARAKNHPAREVLRVLGAALAGGVKRLSAKGRRMMLAGAAILLGLMVASVWWLEPPATLTLQVKNSFPEATLTLSVDGRTAYSGDLSVDRRNVKAFGRKLAEWGNQEFSRELKIAAGTHEIRVTVTPEGEAPLVQVLTAELKAGESRRLKLTAGRKHGDALDLRLN
jgi:hypothetical protein